MTNYEKLTAMKEVGGENVYKKVDTANYCGVYLEDWVRCQEVLPEYDTNNSGSFTQDEVTAAIGSMTGLTISQKAILWQLHSIGWSKSKNKVSGWSEKNNPFSAAVGAQVKAYYAKLAKEE